MEIKERIIGLDVVRAVAIILVLLSHSLGFIYPGENSFFISFVLGFYGVELFFVLSGFLIGKILFSSVKLCSPFSSLKNFWMRRWLRTLPMYFLVLPIYYLGNLWMDGQNYSVLLWKYVVFLQNTTTDSLPFFGVSWSLTIEEWFYICFPLLFVLIGKGVSTKNTNCIWKWTILFFMIVFLLMRLFFFLSRFYILFRS